MRKIRVLIADDLQFFRKILVDLFNNEPDFEVTGIYDNGADLIAALPQQEPDLILTDYKMPKATGLDVIKELRRTNRNIPVIIISSYTKNDNEAILECLELGAADIIEKPSEKTFDINFTLLKTQILKKIRAVYNNLRVSSAENSPVQKTGPGKTYGIIGIGASTGGTKALTEILPALKPFKETVILISQHMPPRYTAAFAQRLATLSKNPVQEAVHGERARKGTIYLAPGNCNLLLVGDMIVVENAEHAIIAPSVDAMFSSLIPFGTAACGVLLTGMGNDGAAGLKMMHDAGALAIVQDRQTSVVWGMPRAAAELFLVDYIMPLYLIPQLLNLCIF